MWSKRSPFFPFRVFLYLIVIILIEDNKKNLTLCKITRNEEKFYEFWVNIIADVIKHVTLKF